MSSLLRFITRAKVKDSCVIAGFYPAVHFDYFHPQLWN